MRPTLECLRTSARHAAKIESEPEFYEFPYPKFPGQNLTKFTGAT